MDESVFAAHVIVRHYDAAHADQPAVSAYLAAAGAHDAKCTLRDGSTAELAAHLQSPARAPRDIVGVDAPPADAASPTSLPHVAAVLALVDLRAAADTAAANGNELRHAAGTMERLLTPLTALGLPVSARGTARRVDTSQAAHPPFGALGNASFFVRTRRRRTRLHAPDDCTTPGAAMLAAVSARLRLCDIVAHSLAVVVRESLQSESVCVDVLEVSARLLTLAGRLPSDVTSPALLRPVLMAASSRVGSICGAHLEIDPIWWLRAASNLLGVDTQHPCLIVPLFGGMLPASRSYTEEKLDKAATTRGASVLSALVLALGSESNLDSVPSRLSVDPACTGLPNRAASALTGSNVSGALDFLGERVVAVDDDSDVLDLYASESSVFHACEYSCQRAGEEGGLLSLVLSFLGAAARQYAVETKADADVVRSVTTVGIDSDESVAGLATSRADPAFPVEDLFDPKRPGSTVADGQSQSQRLMQDVSGSGGQPSKLFLPHSDAHREVGALAFDTLSLLLESEVDSSKGLDVVNQSALTSVLVGACEAISVFTSLPCLSFVGPWSDVPSEHNRPYSRSAPPSPLFPSQMECVLVTAICSFAEVVGSELGRRQLCDDNWVQIANGVSATSCPVDIIARMFCNAPRYVVGRVVTEALVSRCLQNPSSRIPLSAHSRVRAQHCLLWGTRYAAEFFCHQTAPDLLRVLVENIDNFRCSREDVSTFELCEGAAVVGLLSLGWQCLMEGDRAAVIAYQAFSRRLEHAMGTERVSLADVESVQSSIRSLSDQRDVAHDLVSLCSRIRLALCRLTEAFFGDLLKVKLKDVVAPSSLQRGTGRSDDNSPDGSETRMRKLFLESAQELFSHVDSMLLDQDQSRPDTVDLTSSEPPESEGYKLNVNDECGVDLLSLLRPRSDRMSVSQALKPCVDLTRHVLHSDKPVLLRDVIAMECSLRSFLDFFMASSQLESTLSVDVSPLFEFAKACIDRMPFVLRKPYTELKDLSGHSTWSEHWSSDSRESTFVKLEKCALYLELAGEGRWEQTLSLVVESLAEIVFRVGAFKSVHRGHASLSLASQLAYHLAGTESAMEASSVSWVQQALRHLDNDIPDDVLCPISKVAVRAFYISYLIDNAVRSRHEMESLVRIFDRTEDDQIYDALLLVTRNKDDDVVGSVDGGKWIAQILPRVLLDEVLEKMMIPCDGSAVCAEASARYLNVLSESCVSRSKWRHVVHLAFARRCDRSFDTRQESFVDRVCERSVLNSATTSSALFGFLRQLWKAECSHALDGCAIAWLSELYRAAVATLRTRIVTLRLNDFKRLIEFCALLAGLGDWISELKPDEEGIKRSATASACSLSSFVHDIAGLLSSLWDPVAQSHIPECIDSFGKAFHMVELLSCLQDRVSYLGQVSKPSVPGPALLDALPDLGSTEVDEIAVDPDAMLERTRVAELASKLCTFTATGSQFVEQHWYFCHTCDLIGTEGVCSVCAQVCHAGHDLSYSRHSRFFCDCGASAPSAQASTQASTSEGSFAERPRAESLEGFESVSTTSVRTEKPRRTCICLRPRHAGHESVDSLETRITDQIPGDCQEASRKLVADVLPAASPTGPRDSVESPVKRISDGQFIMRYPELLQMMSSGVLGSALASTVRGLLCHGGPHANFSRWVVPDIEANQNLSHESAKCAEDTRVAKPGTLGILRRAQPLSEKVDSAPGLGVRGSRVSLSYNGKVLAYIDGNSRVVLRSVLFLGTLPEATSSPPLSPEIAKVDVAFPVQSLEFHPDSIGHVLVSGLDRVCILSLDSRGRPQTRVDLAIGLVPDEFGSSRTQDTGGISKDGDLILRAQWVRGDGMFVAVTTQRFVKVYDVSDDPMCPMFFAEPRCSSGASAGGLGNTSAIVDAVVCSSMAHDLLLFVLTAENRLLLADLCCSERGPVPLVSASDRYSPTAPIKMVSLGATGDSNGLWIALDDGSLVLHRTDKKVSSLVRRGSSHIRYSKLYELGRLSSGLVVVSQANAAFEGYFLQNTGMGKFETVSLPSGLLEKHCGLFAFPSSSITGYSPGISLGLVLEDGSIHLVQSGARPPWAEHAVRSASVGPWKHEHEVSDLETDLISEDFAEVALSAGVSQRKRPFNPIPSVVGFVESCQLVSDDISLSGDIEYIGAGVRSSGRGRISPAPASGQESFVGPNPRKPFRIVVHTGNESVAILGLRVQIGATERSRAQAPGEIRVFGRPVKWSKREASSKRWVDVPVTIPECLASPREVVLELEPRRASDGTVVGDGTVLFDALQVYGVPVSSLAERAKRFEMQSSQFVNVLIRTVAKRRLRRLSDYRSFPAHFNAAIDSSRFTRLDSWSKAVILCLRLLADVRESVPQDLALKLRFDIDAHETQAESAAFRRFCNSRNLVRQSNHLLWSEWALEHLGDKIVATSISSTTLANGDVFSELAYSKARFCFVQDVVSRFFVSPEISLNTVAPRVFERAVFVLARAYRQLVSSDTAPDFAESVGACNDDLLGVFCDLFLKLRPGDLSNLVSVRDLCGNFVDILLGSQWTSASAVAAREDHPYKMAVEESVCPSIRFLSSILVSPVALLRVHVLRHAIDLLHVSSALRWTLAECSLGERRNFWLHGAKADRVSSNNAGVDSQLRDAVSEVDDGHQWTFQCDICAQGCEPVWWHCAECDDFDLCKDCVQKRGSDLPSPHTESHLLLRGVQDSVDATPYPCPVDLSKEERTSLCVYRNMCESVFQSLQNLHASRFHGLQMVEPIELLQRLASPPTDARRRSLFLSELFGKESMFKDSMCVLVGSTDASEWGRTGLTRRYVSSQAFPRNRRLVEMECIFLLLRFLANLGDVAAVPYLLSNGFVAILGSFLERLAPVVEGDVKSLDFEVRVFETGEDDERGSPNTGDMRAPVLVPHVDTGSLTASLLRTGSREGCRVENSSIFCSAACISPAVEATEAILQVLSTCLGSVAGTHFDAHVKSIPKGCLSALAFLRISRNLSELSLEEADRSRVALGDASILEISHLARSLLKRVCGSDDLVDEHLDHHVMSIRLERLKTVSSSDSLCEPSHTDDQIEIARAVSSLHAVASRRPENWKKFVEKETETTVGSAVLQSPLAVVFSALSVNVGDTRLHALDLFVFAIRGSRHFGFSQVSGSSKIRDTSAEVEPSAWPNAREKTLFNGSCIIPFLSQNAFERVRHLVKNVILRASDIETRSAAASVLESFVRVAQENSDGNLLRLFGDVLVKFVPAIFACGRRGLELADVLVSATEAARTMAPCDMPWIVELGRLLSTLVSKCAGVLSTHPNSHVYKQLSSILVMDGYFLEMEPCLSCCITADEDKKRTSAALESIRAEAKYTHKAIFSRLISRHNILGISLKISDPNKMRLVRTVKVFSSARTVADAAELKAKDHDWRLCTTLHLAGGQSACSVDLDVPVVAANLKIEFSSFYDGSRNTSTSDGIGSVSGGTGSDLCGLTLGPDASRTPNTRLQCPRCSRQVTDRYGICRSCGENSFQCRACRNIMYEVLDGFLCNECGYCKHGRFEFGLVCTPSYAAEPILSEVDRKRASAAVEQQTRSIHRHFDELKSLRAKLLQVLNSPGTFKGDVGESASPRDSEIPPDVPSTPSSRRLEVAGGVDIGNMEVLLRTVIGEEGLSLLPSGLAITSSTSGSPDLSSSLRDITGHIGRDRSHGGDDGGRPGLPVPREDESEQHDGKQSLRRRRSHRGSVAMAIYDDDCRRAFTAMSRCVRSMTATRAELGRYASSRTLDRARPWTVDDSLDQGDLFAYEAENRPTSSSMAAASTCYGCTQAFMARCLPLLAILVKHSDVVRLSLATSDFPVILVRCGSLLDTDAARQAAREMILDVIRDDREATASICQAIMKKVEFCIDAHSSVDVGSAASMELTILAEFSSVNDTCWEERLRMVFQILFRATQYAIDSAAVAEQIVLPCLRTASDFLRSPSMNESGGKDHVESSDLDTAMRDTRLSDHGSDDASCGRLGASSRSAKSSDVDEPEFSSSRQGNRECVDRDSRDATSQGTSTCESKPGPCLDGNDLEAFVEQCHDQAVESVVFSDWMDGRQNFSTWPKHFVDIKKQSEKAEVDTQSLVLRRCFQAWRRVSRKDSSSIGVNSSLADSGDELSWAMSLALNTPSSVVRVEACRLLEVMCSGEDLLVVRLLDSLLGPCLEMSARVGVMSMEYFDVVERLIEPSDMRLYLIATGFLGRAAKAIEKEGQAIACGETEFTHGNVSLNLFHGYVLHRLVSLFQSVLSSVRESSVGVRERLLDSGERSVVGCLVSAYMSVQKVVSLRTKMIDKCQACLEELLSSQEYLFLPPCGESVVTKCVAALNEAHLKNNVRATATLLELMCGMLCPQKEEPVYHLVLEKASSQEEFIRGNMTRETYPTTEFDGPLMRDVKRKICQDLDLMSLLEDDLGDFGLELIVAGNLVKLDLPIAAVYEHVWRGSPEAAQMQWSGGQRRGLILRRGRGGRANLLPSRTPIQPRVARESAAPLEHPPMYVTFRLSGLDGEATEPIIDSLPDTSQNNVDPEEEFKGTRVLGQVSGLSILLSLLSGVGSWSDASESSVRDPALKLLRASCEIASNRMILSSLPGAIGTLMDCVVSALDRGHENSLAIESAESLSIATEKILSEHSTEFEANLRNFDELEEGFSADSLSRLQVVLDHLGVVTSAKAEASLLHLLPFLMRGSQRALELARSHFEIEWEAINTSADSQRLARQLSVVLNSGPCGTRCEAFSALLVSSGTGKRAMDVLRKGFPSPKEDHAHEWQASLDSAGPTLALKVLKGLASNLIGCSGSSVAAESVRQLALGPDTLRVLCQLEIAVSSTGLGSAAEEFLEELQKDGVLAKAIFDEHSRIRSARRAAAEAYRAAAVASTLASVSQAAKGGSGKDGTAKGNAVSRSAFSFMDDVEDEIGPACVVCGDGFTSRPEEALGIYVLSRRTSSSATSDESPVEDNASADTLRALSRSRETSLFVGSPSQDVSHALQSRRHRQSSGIPGQCFSNVTHFNAIHLSCHRESARTDRSLRPPRDEWEGATLRNSQTKCNNIFPVKPPACFDEKGSDSKARGPRGVADSSYEAALNFYFGRLSSLLRVSVPQSTQCMHDVAECISRFGVGSPTVFAEHAMGGGPHSNVCLIPHMLQLAWHVIDTSKPTAAVGSKSSSDRATDSCGTRAWLLADALVTKSYAEWKTSAKDLVSGLESSGDERGMREVAFVATLQRCLKSEARGSGWRSVLMARIAKDEEWLSESCDVIAGEWERQICGISSFTEFEAVMSRQL